MIEKSREDFMDEACKVLEANVDPADRGALEYQEAMRDGTRRWVNAVKGEEDIRGLALEMVKTCHKTMATVGSPRPIPSVDWFVEQLKKAKEL